MAYFECIIGSGGGGGSTGIPLIVTCDAQFAGVTISATKSGAATQTAICPSSSPYQVTLELPEDGTWTVSGVVSGQTFSEVVTITPYSVTLNVIPDGATVTPTDVIQTWLHCANIWDKTYTTINQVLSDTTTLLALISSSNAVDYMVRSTTWASSVAANSTAMTYIGNNNYCANALLNNSTWSTAICDSTYYESVLNVKVPTMTSSSTPSGVAYSNSEYSNAFAGWKAFNGDDSSYWNSAANSGNGAYVQYKFTSAVKVKKFHIVPLFSVVLYLKSYKIQASNTGLDGSWVDLYSETLSNAAVDKYVNITNNNSYLYYRLISTDATYISANAVAIYTLQFYGR